MKRYLPVLVFFALCAFVWIAGECVTRDLRDPIPKDPASGSSPLSFPVVNEAVKLLVTTATIALAGCGVLAFSDKGEVRALRAWEVYAMIVAIVAASSAMYFAFATYLFSATLLDQGTFLSTALPIAARLRMSYYSLLSSVAALGVVFVMRLSEPRDPQGGAA